LKHKITPHEAKILLAKRRAKDAKLQKPFVLTEFLFKEQLDFVNDPSRYATAVCSVRAGKTVACAADLISTALTLPGTTGLYVTLARSSAKKIVWPDLLRILKQYNIPAKTHGIELSVSFPNGSKIYCTGANTEAETEKLRGLSNVAVAYVDESQAFRSHLSGLVDDVLAKRLYDMNGRLRLIGTPGPIPSGYFYDVSRNNSLGMDGKPVWAHHSWTLHQNPWIEKKSGKTVEELIQQDMARKGVTRDDPSIQRECYGRWVKDEESLLLVYNNETNHYDKLPEATYHYVLGIDVGYKDADSLSVLAWRDNSPVTYLVDEVVTERQLIEELVKQINTLMTKYPISKMVMDTGGLGKKIAEDMKARYALPIEPADKKDKMANYALLNNALRTGNFLAKRHSKFAEDCNILEKDRDKSKPDKIIIKGHSDAVDSALYAFKLSPAYGYTPPAAGPKYGSPEWAIQEAERIRIGIYEDIRRQQDEMHGELGNLYEESLNLDQWKKP
jgi:hypothetical protein